MLPPICAQPRYAAVFPDIDAMIARINNAANQPAFDTEVNARKNWAPNFAMPDSGVLETCIHLIAYSQQAQARAVGNFIANGGFNAIFGACDLAIVAASDGDDIYNKHWNNGLSVIRFPSKIVSMIECAAALQRLQAITHLSFMGYLQNLGLPVIIASQQNLFDFWNGFVNIQNQLGAVNMPFFDNLTSLCHLLMMLGYDCAKPDSVVMGTASRLGIIPAPRRKGNFSVAQRRQVIETMQVYCLCHGMRVPILDLYFLVCGGQTGVVHLVNRRCYPCP